MDRYKSAVAVFDKCADIYQDKFMDVSLYADSLDLFCEAVSKEDANILELACGPGNITKYLLNKRPGYKILGTDLAPNMIALAKINNPAAEFQLMDCRKISTLGKKYDAMMCGFCLPYLSKEEAIRLIRNASELLEAHGVLYLSTMEGGYSTSGYKTSSSGGQVYIHYHEAGYLTQALKESGFTIIDVQRQEYPANDGTITTDLVIMAGK